MKKNLTATVLILISVIHVNAQKFQTGIIKLKNGTTIDAKIQIYKRDVILSARKITYQTGKQILKLKLSEIDHISLGESIYSPFTSASGSTKLGKRMATGQVELYRKYGTRPSTVMAGAPGSAPTLTGQDLFFMDYVVNEKESVWIKKSNLKATILKFFPDCGQLKARLRLNTSLESKFPAKAIEFGNKNCN